jgi:ATP-dependent Clp protease protease subunit
MEPGESVKKIEDFNSSDRLDLTLLENSIYFLTGEINEDNVLGCIKWIIFENIDVREKKKLTLYINSTGGDLYQAFALIDVMKKSHHPIAVIGLGSVMSSALLIFSAGTQGQRYASRNCSFMSHQYHDTVIGKYHEHKSSMKEGDRCINRMIEILEEATGLTRAKIRSKLLSASDTYFDADQIVELGIADHIL